MILSCQYFLVYACAQIARTLNQFVDSVNLERFEGAVQTATHSMNFAPMLSVLFIAARMRALQMDPVGGAVQPWAQRWFFVCTYAVLCQTLAAVAVPLLLGGTVREARAEGVMEYADVGREKLA